MVKLVWWCTTHESNAEMNQLNGILGALKHHPKYTRNGLVEYMHNFVLNTVKLDECIDPSRSSAGQVKGRKVVELETLQPTILDAWTLEVKPLEEGLEQHQCPVLHGHCSTAWTARL